MFIEISKLIDIDIQCTHIFFKCANRKLWNIEEQKCPFRSKGRNNLSSTVLYHSYTHAILVHSARRESCFIIPLHIHLGYSTTRPDTLSEMLQIFFGANFTLLHFVYILYMYDTVVQCTYLKVLPQQEIHLRSSHVRITVLRTI